MTTTGDVVDELAFKAKQQRLKLPPPLPKCEPLLQKCGGSPLPIAGTGPTNMCISEELECLTACIGSRGVNCQIEAEKKQVDTWVTDAIRQASSALGVSADAHKDGDWDG